MTIKERWSVFRIFFGKLQHSGTALILLFVAVFTIGPALVNRYGNLGLKDNGPVLNFFFGWFMGSIHVLLGLIIVLMVSALMFFFYRLLYYFYQECKLNWNHAKIEHEARIHPVAVTATVTPTPTPTPNLSAKK
jgi:hypothetical protein